MAEALGVRANRVIATAFAISGVLAAAVACMIVAQTGLVQPRMGLQLVVVAFVGTVIGGLGSLPGAAIGGFAVGVGSILLQALLPETGADIIVANFSHAAWVKACRRSGMFAGPDSYYHFVSPGGSPLFEDTCPPGAIHMTRGHSDGMWSLV